MAGSGNSSLHKAKDAKHDEFYTQLSDIENELQHYKDHFRGKVVFCNCDDPYESNFFKYFILNFNYLGLKKLITTCYSTSPVAGTQISLFDDPSPNNSAHPYKVEIDHVEDLTGNGAIDLDDIQLLLKTPGIVQTLEGDGDFRSAECIELLKKADIVVTNPPFSLFRDYVSLLIEYRKQFVILGNKNCITYKEVFPLIRDNAMWIGATPMSKEMYFDAPDEYINNALEQHKDRTVVKVNGKYMARASAIWFTNLDHRKRHEELDLFKRYRKHEDEYPHYDNYDAVEVSKVSEIPYDYDGVMGVPITFMDKYNPEQFSIIGLAPERLAETESSLQLKRYRNAIQHKKDGSTCSGNKVNDGPTLLHDIPPDKFPYYTSETVPNKYIEVLYARILIRRKD